MTCRVVMSPLPTVTLSRNNASIAEAGGVCTLTATLSATSTQTVTVNLGYTGTAIQGTDYHRRQLDYHQCRPT